MAERLEMGITADPCPRIKQTHLRWYKYSICRFGEAVSLLDPVAHLLACVYDSHALGLLKQH